MSRQEAPPPSFADLVQLLSRRRVLQGGLGASTLAFLGCTDETPDAPAPGPGPAPSPMAFTSVTISKADTVTVPPEYTYQVVNAWGDPIMPGAPEFKQDASQPAADQARQAGMHHDGMEFFPLPRGTEASDHGLLAVNFEYTDDNLLTPDGMAVWTPEKVQKSQNAHGIGVVEIKLENGAWKTVKDSALGRRVTASTPITLRGPAAGHALLKTAADPEGRTVLGTFQNCACGRTPWGTYLACEENFGAYFVRNASEFSPLHDRYGIAYVNASWGFRWEEHDLRFDAVMHPNECNRFGWVVEIDPFDPASKPVKRTALGRLAHEGATVRLAADNRVVVYMGDDDFRSKYEHIYKFVSRRAYVPGSSARDNDDLLDDGTLYAARFEADGTGRWLALAPGMNGLTAAEFPTLAEILINTRTAADRAGATYMDRPEWIAVHPTTHEVYCSLTNNTARGTLSPAQQPYPVGADAANPRAPNLMGHIIRWREQGGDAAATTFAWDVFLLAGDPQATEPMNRGNVPGGVAFAEPDGLAFDKSGRLWILTDSSAQNMARAEWANIGNNQMLVADPASKQVRRFLTGPVGCEITGFQLTPDQRTLFVNIQHPGEAPRAHPGRNDAAKPKAYSSWPDGDSGGRPRSATIAIRRKDGGLIGT
jgi:secreted PhoX family phosphatase